LGDGRKFIAVLVVLDPQIAPAWAKARGIEGQSTAELAEDQAVVGEVRRALQQANTHLSRVEQFKRFTILPAAWSPEFRGADPDHEAQAAGHQHQVQPSDRVDVQRPARWA